MSLVLHISDTHFGTERPPVVDALVALSRQLQPDLTVLSGDVTQRARSAQFRAAREFLDRMSGPKLVIPGNHDIPLFDLWTRLRRPLTKHRAAFGKELEPVFRSAGLLVIGVNTTRRWRHKHGEVSAQQVDRVAQLLAGADPAQLRLVVVHQPVATTQASDRSNRLRGAAPALRRWAAAGVDLVLGGHIHLPYVVELPGLARRAWAVQAGTAVSARVRDKKPNSVNLLRWHADAQPPRCDVEQWDYDNTTRAFAQATVTSVVPQRL